MAQAVRCERCGQQIGERAFDHCAIGAWVEDATVRIGKLCDGLSARTAGLAGNRRIAIGNGHGCNADVWPVCSNGIRNCILLGAHGQAIACVLHVAAGNNAAVCKQNGGTDMKAAVRRIGVVRSHCGGCAELLYRLWMVHCRRHRVLRLNLRKKGCKLYDV